MSKNDNHLPLYGVGPLLVAPLIITALLGIILTHYKKIPILIITPINAILTAIGIILIITGAIFWLTSVKSKIQDKIKANKLETGGIYGIIRHPIYAAFLYASTGIILISKNLYLFPLPIIYWAFLALVLEKTEEKWLLNIYGDDYINYSKKVNRFIPRMVK